MAPGQVRRGSGAVIVLVVVSLLAFGCTASSARPPLPVSLPVPRSGQITFYLASGLGVPNWAILPAALPPPG